MRDRGGYGEHVSTADAEASDAEAADARERRRTWMIGGAVLVLAAVVGLVARGPLAWLYYGDDLLWGVGVLILVIGIGRAGSITRRRPFATTVVILQVIVASPAASWYLSTQLPDLPPSTNAAEDAWSALFMPYYVLVFVLTVTAVFMIGFAGAVPKPWSWAPSWVLVWSAVLWWVSLQTFSSAPLGTWAATVGAYIGPVSGAIGIAFLGILAIVLGRRSTRASVAV